MLTLLAMNLVRITKALSPPFYLLVFTVSLASIFSGAAVLCSANAQDARDDNELLLMSVLTHSGERVINRAQFTYSVSNERPAATEEALHREVAEHEKIFEQLISAAKTDAERERLGNARQQIDAEVRKQNQGNKKVEIDIFFAMDGPALGGDRYLETTQRREGFPPVTIESSYRRLGVGTSITIDSERQQSTAMIRDQSTYYGTQEPHQLGRIVGFLEQVAYDHETRATDISKSIRRIEISESQPVQGLPTLLVEVSFKNAAGDPSGSTVFTTVPAMGYITPIIRDYLTDGRLFAEWLCDDYVQVPNKEREPLWFPLQVKYSANTPDGGPVDSQRYRFKADAISLNSPVPRGRFSIGLTPSMTVSDARTTPVASFTVKNVTNLNLDDVDSLSSNHSLEPIAIDPRGDFSAKPAAWRWPRGLLINLTVLAVLAGALWWRRRWSMAVLLIFTLVPGCGYLSIQATEGFPADSDAGCTVRPETIDFGTVSLSSEGLQRTFQIRNLGPLPQRITVETSCGCLVVTPQTIDLNCGESTTVIAIMFPDGRAGFRQSQINVTLSQSMDCGTDFPPQPPMMIPIVAKSMITNEWQATPRRIVSSGELERRAGTVTVTAPRSDWRRVRIGVIGRNVNWEETNRFPAPDDAEESRTFRVEISCDEETDRGLSFTLNGHDSPVLVVPIIMSR